MGVKHMAWNEIARPIHLGQLVGQKEFVYEAGLWETKQQWPDAILLQGPPGVGKTTAGRIIARSALGDFFDPVNFVETNASDDRGLEFVRTELRTLASSRPLGAKRRVVLLDEADGLTSAAQDAARQIIENHAGNCLFILTANNVEKIRPAIKSRCSIYNFKPLSPQEGAIHLSNVCKTVNVSQDILEDWQQHFPRLIHMLGGDLRSCVNVLESTPQEIGALETKVSELDVITDAAIASTDNEWMEMRIGFHKALGLGRDRFFIMRSFYNNISTFFDISDEDGNSKLWSVLAVYGDMMSRIYEWPDSDAAFMDCFVAQLRREMMIK